MLLKERNNKRNCKTIILIQNAKKTAKGTGSDKFLADELIESGNSWAYLKSEKGINIVVNDNEKSDEALRIIGHDIFHFLKALLKLKCRMIKKLNKTVQK